MISVVKFQTQYRPGKEPVDKVLVAPVGAAHQKVRTWHRVSKVNPENVPEDKRDNDSFRDMEAKWSVIGPAYEAWKSGNEIPESGTPLEAWAGVTTDQAAFLKAMAIRTVEDVRDMGEQAIAAMRWPDARKLPKLAKDYLEGADSAAKDAQIAEMAERMAAMEEMLSQQMNDKPKRGRPPKEKADEAA